MPSIPKKDLPRFVRTCYDAWKKANVHTRSAEIERLKFYVGDQWRPEEIQKRREQGRPYLVINKCKPPVDQIEGDVRLNPPGPECLPVGDNPEDACDPDIIEGLIREVEYRSMSQVADSTAIKYCAASGYGVIELATEYANERDDSQQLRIDSVEDPQTVFFDPAARRANREDAKWAGKIKQYSKVEYEMVFGKQRNVLQPGGVQIARGWLADAFGMDADAVSMIEWTGARDGGDGRWQGPFLVCEFYLVEEEKRTSRLYSDKIWRFDDEDVPAGVDRLPGDQYTRSSPKKTIKKYIVDALEAQDDTEWLGTLIPLFPVLGPEIYIDGKLYRLSLIAPAIDSNRSLNYVATTAVEITGLVPKSPMIGPKGSFDDPRWATINTEIYATLEYTPVFVTDETTGAQQLAPPPTRNMWEAAIQWILELKNSFSEDIKAVTATYNPSLGQQQGDQSGKAIEQLRSESNVGNFSYADNLHRTKTIIYQQMCVIFPKILTGPQALAIVRPDNQHEVVRINQEFGADGIDPQTGKKGKRNNLALGRYSVRAVAGPSFQTRQDQGLKQLMDAAKINPQILANPAVMAKLIRLIGQGNPEMDGIADLIAPNPAAGHTPQQMQSQMQQLTAQNGQLKQLVQKQQQDIASKLPQIQADLKKNELDNATRLLVAQINASNDMDRAQADQLIQYLEMTMGMAHDTALQAADQQHQAGMAQQAQQAAVQQQQNEPEPVAQ